MKIGETKCPIIKLVDDDVTFICVALPGTGGTKDVIVRLPPSRSKGIGSLSMRPLLLCASFLLKSRLSPTKL